MRDLAPGEVVAGRFTVQRFLARGGMGGVYAATDGDSGNAVALKILEEVEDGPLGRRRFFNEAAMCSTLDHPNVVRVLDFGADGPRAWIAMELLEGETLHRYLKRNGRLPVEVALACAARIAEGLGAAHAKGFVHRDLKPSNIFVVGEDAGTPVLKLLDFGLAKRTDRDIDLTVTGTFLGSPRYMSPEQIKGQEIGPPSDVYNVGLVLWRMVVGKDLFDRPEASAILVAHVTEKPPRLGEVAPDLASHRDLEWLLRTCLAKPPDERFTDMRELVEAMDIVRRRANGEAVGIPERTLRGERPVFPTVSRDQRPWLVAAAVMVGLAGVSVVGVALVLLGFLLGRV
ncbi:MAG: serine/threonine protein kinase [Alphaproteobacteria bacterium]|nr:serine/threonine protein kinase [Alphaproteobacteria bacterium]MCB9693522.1 serine/threonine protein kinase [Alphaproteobacteria bacterium]